MFQHGPVRYPSAEEFRYFNRYIAQLESDPEIRHAGSVKIVPPDGFRQQHGLGAYQSGFYNDLMVSKNMRISAPIRQRPHNVIRGVWKVVNVIEKENIKATTFLDSALRIDKVNRRRLRSNQNQAPKQSEQGPFPEYSVDELKQLEELFWKKLDSSGAPLYGADYQKSFFERTVTVPEGEEHELASFGSWNLNHLCSVLDLVAARISGVNTPYLYFGQWKALFAWHTEDVDLHSINFLHFGMPKQWYAISPNEIDKMYELGRKLFPAEFRMCPEYFRHKVLMIDPEIVVAHGITVYKMTQYSNEFVITFSGAFHCGFNYGANCAESVNFGTETWVNRGDDVKRCWCSPESVHINMTDFKEMFHRVDKAHEWSEYVRIKRVLNSSNLIMPLFSHQKRKRQDTSEDEVGESSVKMRRGDGSAGRGVR
jgi:hypothetical protein